MAYITTVIKKKQMI